MPTALIENGERGSAPCPERYALLATKLENRIYGMRCPTRAHTPLSGSRLHERDWHHCQMHRLLTCMRGPIIGRSCIPARGFTIICPPSPPSRIVREQNKRTRRRGVHELRRSTLIRMAAMAAGRPAGRAAGHVRRRHARGGRGVVVSIERPMAAAGGLMAELGG